MIRVTAPRAFSYSALLGCLMWFTVTISCSRHSEDRNAPRFSEIQGIALTEVCRILEASPQGNPKVVVAETTVRLAEPTFQLTAPVGSRETARKAGHSLDSKARSRVLLQEGPASCISETAPTNGDPWISWVPQVTTDSNASPPILVEFSEPFWNPYVPDGGSFGLVLRLSVGGAAVHCEDCPTGWWWLGIVRDDKGTWGVPAPAFRLPLYDR